MVGRFSFGCGRCKGKTFRATGFANDEPLGDTKEEWQSKLFFVCENCSNKVAEIVINRDGETRLVTNFST